MAVNYARSNRQAMLSPSKVGARRGPCLIAKDGKMLETMRELLAN